jgi:glutathione S-transferase
MSDSHWCTYILLVFKVGHLNSCRNIFKGEQKKDWFLRLNPNGTLPHQLKVFHSSDLAQGLIPVLLDSSLTSQFPIFESSAILIYLQKKIDTTFIFGFRDERESLECLQWLLFWHGTGANAQGRKFP